MDGKKKSLGMGWINRSTKIKISDRPLSIKAWIKKNIYIKSNFQKFLNCKKCVTISFQFTWVLITPKDWHDNS